MDRYEVWCLPRPFGGAVLAIDPRDFGMVVINRSKVPDESIIEITGRSQRFIPPEETTYLYDDFVANLTDCLKRLVTLREQKLIQWINTAGWHLQKFHRLQFIHGVRAKLTERILSERKQRPFESFADMTLRLKVDIHEMLSVSMTSQLLGKKFRLLELLV